MTAESRSPIERHLSAALREFETHLKRIGLTDRVRDARLRGAREFVVFILGRGHQKFERTKDRI